MSILGYINKCLWLLKWKMKKKELKNCGNDCYMGKNFNLKSPQYISIGNNTHFGKDCQVCAFDSYRGIKHTNTPNIMIGDNVTITDHCYISCMNEVTIGNGCLLGINTFITDNFHGNASFDELLIPPDERSLYSKGPVHIGENVWIGRNVCIMPNVTIGNGAIIGANAVVTHNVPDNCVVGGIPAKIIKRISKN